MYYQYISLIVTHLILLGLYLQFRKHVSDVIRNHIGKIQIYVWICMISVIGFPTKFESTSLSGKMSFNATSPNLVPRVEGTLPPSTANLEKQYEILKLHSKKVQDETYEKNY